MNLTIGRLSDLAELPTIRAMFREYADSMALDLEFQNFSEEYERIRLDTIASRMGEAVALYHSLGFRLISPYCESRFPDVLFMELSLNRDAS